MKYAKILSFCIIIIGIFMLSTGDIAKAQAPSGDQPIELITQTCADDPWNCDMCEALKIVGQLLRIITRAFLPIMAIGFMYAGFLFITDGSNPAARAKARRVLLNMFVGLCFVLGAYFIVDTFYSIIGVDASYRELFDGVNCPDR